MKRTLLTFIFFSVFLANGQIRKAALLLGPSFNYSENKRDDKAAGNSTTKTQYDKSENFNANLRLGYFISDKVVVGVTGGYSSGWEDVSRVNTSVINFPATYSSTNKTKLVSLGVFSRAYKMFNENKFGFFGHLDGFYQTGTSDFEEHGQSGSSGFYEEKGEINGILVGLRPGIVYFITPRIGIEGTFGAISFYRQNLDVYSKGIQISTSSVSNLDINLGLTSFYLGMNFYFGRKE